MSQLPWLANPNRVYLLQCHSHLVLWLSTPTQVEASSTCLHFSATWGWIHSIKRLTLGADEARATMTWPTAVVCHSEKKAPIKKKNREFNQFQSLTLAPLFFKIFKRHNLSHYLSHLYLSPPLTIMTRPPLLPLPTCKACRAASLACLADSSTYRRHPKNRQVCGFCSENVSLCVCCYFDGLYVWHLGKHLTKREMEIQFFVGKHFFVCERRLGKALVQPKPTTTLDTFDTGIHLEKVDFSSKTYVAYECLYDSSIVCSYDWHWRTLSLIGCVRLELWNTQTKIYVRFWHVTKLESPEKTIFPYELIDVSPTTSSQRCQWLAVGCAEKWLQSILQIPCKLAFVMIDVDA